MKILIDALNAKPIAGGTFQICLNFIKRTTEAHNDNIEWIYFVTQDIDKFLHNTFEKQLNSSYFVFPRSTNILSFIKVQKRVKVLEDSIKPDLVYSITAPTRYSFKSTLVLRHTNPWVTHPNKYAKQKVDWKTLLRLRVICFFKKQMLKRGNYFVTQSQSAKNGIKKITKVENNKIAVIPNVLPACFSDLKYEKRIDDNIVNIACIAVPHPHKNLDIIPDVLLCLKDKYNIDNIVFHLTLPKNSSQWIAIREKTQQYGLGKKVINHGYRTQMQLVDIYSICNLAFTPSLLETFSAAPLEAMFFQCYVVASDLDFNRDVTGDAALYFKPMDAEDAASKIHQILTDDITQTQLKQNMRQCIKLFDSYEHHYNQTIDFFSRIINEVKFKNIK